MDAAREEVVDGGVPPAAARVGDLEKWIGVGGVDDWRMG